jgi:hypothetical protein
MSKDKEPVNFVTVTRLYCRSKVTNKQRPDYVEVERGVVVPSRTSIIRPVIRLEDIRLEEIRLEDIRLEDIRLEDIRLEDLSLITERYMISPALYGMHAIANDLMSCKRPSSFS